MTTTFTASNGVTVTIDDNGYLLAAGGTGPHDHCIHATGGADLGVQALREYFQHERDTDLGRWRDPENPDMVVYRPPFADSTNDRDIYVIDETLGRSHRFWEEVVNRSESANGLNQTARRYFAAHPDPKPWHDAKPGEAWVLTIDGTEHLAQAITGRIEIYPHDADPEFFIPTLIPANTIGDIWEHTWSPSDHRITAGRRIWPDPEEPRDA